MSLLTVLLLMALGFIIALAAGVLLLWVLPKLQIRQTAYEDAPQTHQKKTGTPTMGGLAMIAAVLPAFFAYTDLSNIALLGLIIACGAIGFFDDYQGIRKGRNLGLRARTKYLLTAVAAIAFLRYAHDYWPFPAISDVEGIRHTIFHAGSYALVVPYWLWLLLGVIAVTGTIHAVNLTDGLDGLVAGTIIPPLLAFLIIALNIHVMAGGDWPVTLCLAIGGIFGFLVYNRHPAKMFMGDTGSLALGALLSGVAILTGEMLLLILIGGVFVAEALSVIVQVTYFKRTGGKRIFRMSPLHHHFELVGWPETTVTARFWLASVLLSGLGLAIVR